LIWGQNQTLVTLIGDALDKGNLRLDVIFARRRVPVNLCAAPLRGQSSPHMFCFPEHNAFGLRHDGDSNRRSFTSIDATAHHQRYSQSVQSAEVFAETVHSQAR
jgi:hypothetical protein